MKNIPNLFTLLNLICGCIAIVLALQTGESIIALENFGETQVMFPERIAQASVFIFIASIIDFLDGFLARLMKAPSEMGKQLDSLSDVVSFGVAPGVILYQLLRMGYAQGENGLDVSVISLLPAFIFSAAAAWRLAKFNVSIDQSDSFRGVPTPAAGLLIASFPLIIHYDNYHIAGFFINVWFLYGVILILSWLMVSDIRLMALKFRDYSFANNLLKYILLALSLVAIIVLKWLAAPVIFVLYVILSLFDKPQPIATASGRKDTLDLTV